MTWMNEYDVEESVDLLRRSTAVPHLQVASRSMMRLVNWTNRNSDGWPYWKLPSTASNLLQTALIKAGEDARAGRLQDIGESDLEKILKPVRSFLKNRDADPALIDDPPPAPPVDIEANLRQASRLIAAALTAMEAQK